MDFISKKTATLFGFFTTKKIDNMNEIQSLYNEDSIDILVEDGEIENVVSDKDESNDLGIDV